MGDKGLVLFFVRSADWCPICQAQLMELNGGAADIEARGYRLAGLSYDRPETLAAYVARRDITYTLLSDPKSEVITRYGLIDPQYPPGSRAHGVPQPIIFFIGPDEVIRAKLYENTFKKRPPLSLVIDTLDRIARTKER